jgi:hypothetical protein
MKHKVKNRPWKGKCRQYDAENMLKAFAGFSRIWLQKRKPVQGTKPVFFLARDKHFFIFVWKHFGNKNKRRQFGIAINHDDSKLFLILSY